MQWQLADVAKLEQANSTEECHMLSADVTDQTVKPKIILFPNGVRKSKKNDWDSNPITIEFNTITAPIAASKGAKDKTRCIRYFIEPFSAESSVNISSPNGVRSSVPSSTTLCLFLLCLSELKLSDCLDIYLFGKTLEDSFSYVSRPIFATKHTLESS